jgi:hypothetical protein
MTPFTTVHLIQLPELFVAIVYKQVTSLILFTLVYSCWSLNHQQSHIYSRMLIQRLEILTVQEISLIYIEIKGFAELENVGVEYQRHWGVEGAILGDQVAGHTNR